MKYLALIPMVFLAITPPLDLALDCTINSTFWLWMTLASGFFAFLFLYQKVSVWLKLFVIWCFASCFISKAPFMSFTMYWSLIVCAYYYSLCKQVEDFTLVKKAIQSIFFFVTLMIIMQIFGFDTLLNFKEKTPDVLHGVMTPIVGIIGNRMIASSFVCVLAPFLIFTPLNWVVLIILAVVSWSSGALLSIGAGLAVWSWQFKKLRLGIVLLAIFIPVIFAWKTGDFSKDVMRAGRLPVYLDTLKLSLKHPQGFGIGTYKIVYPVIGSKEVRAQQPGRAWRTTHNDWLQILFEVGFPGFILFTGWLISILLTVIRSKNYLKLAGLAIIATNMAIHFPGRMIQSAFIILMFLGYCSRRDECETS